MARLRNVAMLPVIALAGACWHSDSPTATRGDVIPFSTVYQAQYSGVTEARLQVIGSTAEWADAWREIQGSISPPEPLPQVDLTRQRLLLAAIGTRPNGCYSVEVEAIERSGPALEATVVETRPGAACVCTEAITHPVHVVSLQRSGEAIVGRQESRINRCG